MREEIVKVYKFDELSDAAKQKAIEWYRGDGPDHDWWDFIYEDFIANCALIGLEVKAKDIHFSGFCSQGDGASFTGRWYPCGPAPEGIPEVFGEAFDDLCRIQKEIDEYITETDAPKLDYVKVTRHPGIYVHSHMMNAFAVRDDGVVYPAGVDREFLNVFRRLADYLYRSLEEEYDWLNSDETISENITNNYYEFTESGELWP